MYAGHLYNAARQENLVPKPWKDMEMLIALQSPERFFIGNQPKGLEEYLKRFTLSMGYSATMFAKNRRKNTPVASIKGPRGFSQLAVVSRLFKGRYLSNEPSVSWTRDTIEPIIASKLEDSDDDDDDSTAATPNPAQNNTDTPPHSSSSRKERRKPTNNRVKPAASGVQIRMATSSEPTTMSLASFLERLAHALHAESMELNFDYLSLHRSCWTLLRSVNDACKTHLRIYGPGYLEKEAQLPFVVGYIFMACTGTAQIEGLLSRKIELEGGEVSSRVLATAAEAVNGMIGMGKGEVAVGVLQMELGAEIDMSALT